ncbi:MAG: hypothetical protein ABJA34_07805 [Pseudonocardiales bacterium]
MADPFDTAGIRARVLHAWAASPERFREDANAEEDLALGGYRDRLLVELAQNAADAAVAAGVPGHLRLQLADGCLRAANTGAPLDAAGAAALASLRASAKRDGQTVGRFGVGFAAVLAVTDSPEIASADGGVRFSAAETRRDVAALPSLTAEAARRGGAVPVLRLPRPVDDPPPDGFASEVRLPLRPEAVQVVQAALAALDAAILLALPGLSRIEVGERVIERSGADPEVVISDDGALTSWHVVRAGGLLPPELLADRPVEEREHPGYALLWAVPDSGLTGPQVLHAPTPSDEPLSLPARLVGPFPLGPDRRHVAPGPLTDWLVQRAADAYVDLVREAGPGAEVLRLVPQPGLAAAALDAALCTAVLSRLRALPWLPGELAPPAACALEPALEAAVPLLSDVIPGLLPVPWSGRAAQRPLHALGVRRLGAADVVDAVSGIVRPPAWWHDLYAALADDPDREALASLPVPLADGRLVTGPRGVLLPAPGLAVAALAALDVRLGHPDAVHPLLERLGGLPASPLVVLSDERVRAQVEQAYEDGGAVPLVEAVLALVSAAEIGPGRLPWLADLPLLAEDGQTYPAGELLLPGGALAAVMADDSPFAVVATALVQRWAAPVLEAVGVLATFAALRAPDVDTAEHDLDDEQAYLDEVLIEQGTVLEELAAVRDLEFVDPARWAAALDLLAAGPLRSVLVTDALVNPGGRQVPSYTRWWLARHPVLDGRRPRDLRAAGAGELAGLYEPAPGSDDTLLRLLGCRTGLDDVLSDIDGALDLLDRLGDPRHRCPATTLRVAYRRLAEVLDDVEPPDRVRVAPDRVVSAAEAVVLDVPYALPLLGSMHPVPGGGAVADLLDLPLASELAVGEVGGGVVGQQSWADVDGVDLAAARLGGEPPAAEVRTHHTLTVSGVAVRWWPEGSIDHVDAASGPAALGRALAWRMGRWDLRAAAVEALAAPAEARPGLAAEDAGN